MARVKVVFPPVSPLYETNVPVRIGDVNYGGHLGNDAVLSLVHEARMQMLSSIGCTELNCDGPGFLMADAAVAYKAEAFFGDVITIRVFADEISTRSFSLLYLLQTMREDRLVDVAHVQTGMVSFDYDTRSIVAIAPRLAKFLRGED